MIRKTTPKELLAESLIDLAKIHPIQSITVTDITDNCQVSRQMFYYHFSSKYDLISWIYSDKADKIIEQYIEKEPWGRVAGRIVEFIKEDYIYFKRLLTTIRTCLFIIISLTIRLNATPIIFLRKQIGLRCLPTSFLL